MAAPSCLRLDRQLVWRAFSRAWAKTGKRIAARIAIMAITTSSSIRVNPCRPQRDRIAATPFCRCRSIMSVSFVRPEMAEDVIAAGGQAMGVARQDLPERLVVEPLDVAVDEEDVEDSL